MLISKLKNKSIAILWFGREGRSTLDFLLELWINHSNIRILDENDININYKDIEVISWKNYLDRLDIYDIIIKSPWISLYNDKIYKFREKITSQTEIFFSNYFWRVIWITWTKWKSTTSTLTNEALKMYWYKSILVWNVWKPVFDEINILSQEEYDYVVYELSSYMLEWFSPECFIWVLLNIYPDHLDWHYNFMNYKTAKLNILNNSINHIVNNKLSLDVDKESTFWEWWYYSYKWHNFYINDKKIIKDSKIKLKWDHNKSNITAVIWILYTVWIRDLSKFEVLLSNFKWLSHRIENIWTYSWITFIDDAISTTPESTIEAIKTFWEKIWTIFLWWTDRWYKFSQLVKYLEKYKIKNVVLFPESWTKIKDLLNNKHKILETDSMQKAVQFAYTNTQESKICLLSCASPSYFLWKNFEKKWDEFKREVVNQNTQK